MVTLLLETPSLNPGNKYANKTLSLDYLWTQNTDLLCKLIYHNCVG